MTPTSSSPAVATIDARDLDTPDAWIPRHPDLIRLTGRHPFNCEPPPQHLKTFVTPTDLHFVRNHGAVPRRSWESHTLTIDGGVASPITLSMQELTEKFAEHVMTLPVLVVCSGNRRKEQNMLKKTIGFSWGVGAAATSNYTGVPLHVLLAACGIDRERAKHVWFEGADSLVDGKGYGTSIPAHTALDPTCDVLVAWAMNDEPLSVDHGFPLRIIVPGHVGGRMVKWLARIHVSDIESTNYYHIHDNRLLPSHVDAEKATAENWWSKPEFAIQELNVNSVMLAPAHGEQLDLSGDDFYTISGYAYSGGGRKVIRVELTLNDGKSWQDCRIIYTEKPNAYGKMWCWVQYELRVPVASLLRCKEICVRAWDASMNTQPEFPTWNVMGMMNNPWFRVRVHGVNGGAKALTFEHPTQAGALKGGWMTPERLLRDEAEKPKVGNQNEAVAQAVVVTETSVQQQQKLLAEAASKLPLISRAEVARHNSKESCWFIVRGLVYDATKYLDVHPGGAASILLCAGTDCTEEFESIHSAKAWQMLAPYCIGRVYVSHKKPVDTKPVVVTKVVETKTTASPLTQLTTQLRRRAWRMFAPCGVTDDETQPNDGDNEITSTLSDSPTSSTSEETTSETEIDYSDSKVALCGPHKVPLVLVGKQIVSRDTRIFRFALPAKHLALGLPTGNHVLLYGKVRGKTVVRAYTPISDNDEQGFVSFLVKVYFAGENPAHVEGGIFSQYLDDLHLGSRIEMRGPLGHFTYQGLGRCVVNERPVQVKKLGFIAGGTGITPIFQVMRAILSAPDDTTEVALIYSVRGEKDLLLKDEIDALQKLKPSQCRVFYTLTELVADEAPHWRQGRTRLTLDMVRQVIGENADHVALCGPPGLLEHACLPALAKLGYDCADQVTQL